MPRVKRSVHARKKRRKLLAEAKGFSGITVPYGKDKSMFLLRETGVYNGLPNLIVVDRSGKVVIDSSNEMPLPRTQRTLAEMRHLQESHAAKKTQQGDSGSGGAEEQK